MGYRNFKKWRRSGLMVSVLIPRSSGPGSSPGWGPGGGQLPEKSDGGVRPASQIPYPIYDQKSAIFPTLFIT